MNGLSQTLLLPSTSGIVRPRSAADFRHPAQGGNYQDGAALSSYSTAPEQNGIATQHQDHYNSQVTPAYADYTYSYPGDLNVSADFAADRALKLPKIKLPTVKKIGEELGKIAQQGIGAIAGVYFFPVTVYLQGMESQLNDGRAKTLPQWLKDSVAANYPSIDLNRVRYGQYITVPSLLAGAAMTVGYSIYFPGPLHIEKDRVCKTIGQAADLAINLHWILHEIEHTVQFYKAGADRTAWALKYLANSAISLGGSAKQSHDLIQLEKDADAKSFSLVNQALGAFAKDRPTVPFVYPAGTTIFHELHLPVMEDIGPNNEFPGCRAGMWIRSRNGQWTFRIQEDGNLVVYGPHGEAVWQSHTNGLTSPPYYLCCSPARDQLLFGGFRFTPGTNSWTPERRILFATKPYIPGYESGGFYIVGPHNPINPLLCTVKLEITDIGELILWLVPPGGSSWHPAKMWWTAAPYGRIETTVIPSTTVLLPTTNQSFAPPPWTTTGM